MHSAGSLCPQIPYCTCVPWFKRTPVQLRPADAGQAGPCRVPRRGGGFSKSLPCLHLHQGGPRGQRDRAAPRDPADRLGQLGLVGLSRPREERGSLFKGSSIVGTSWSSSAPGERPTGGKRAAPGEGPSPRSSRICQTRQRRLRVQSCITGPMHLRG